VREEVGCREGVAMVWGVKRGLKGWEKGISARGREKGGRWRGDVVGRGEEGKGCGVYNTLV